MIALDTSALEARLEALEAAVERLTGATTPDETVLTRVEAARYARVGLTILDEAIRTKALRARRIGRRVLIRRDDADTWLAGAR